MTDSNQPRPAIYHVAAAIAVALVVAMGRAAAARAAVEFDVRLDPATATHAVSGRLYVFLSRRPSGEPRDGPDWFAPEPFFGMDVKDFQPGTDRLLNDAADGFPDRLSKLRPGRYRAQALLGHNPDRLSQSRAPGNQYSRVVDVEVAAGPVQTVSLVLDQLQPEKPFPDVPWVKEVSIRSGLLSQFLKREVLEKAAVTLPAGYDDHPQQRYPVIYEVTGFGGSYWDALHQRSPPTAAAGETDFIRVLLDGQCDWGHHVYADSATNGPRGRALVEELVPEIDRRFRTIAAPRGRLLAGHSSGGWSSLWLQVSHPEFFGGVWSSSPDPVDFRDFQRIDLYANPPLSMYYDEPGRPRPIARRGETPVLFYPSFGRMDDVLGRGGQLRSFEAVFSPLDADGLPRKLWNRSTGRIDPEVARAWEKYDIRLQLERNWKTLEPLLRGKLHITVGSLDTFYLDGAVLRLADSLKRLGSDAEITIVPGADHGTVLTSEYFHRVRRQMTAVANATAAR
ncbi:MAG TPA: alpha/beta hydrolase [Pirellulales bacterium]|nr:alpha/beta hydrolase [Pirellulales bacterium]